MSVQKVHSLNQLILHVSNNLYTVHEISLMEEKNQSIPVQNSFHKVQELHVYATQKQIEILSPH